MDPDEPFEALVAPLRADATSGAVALARAAGDVLRRAAIRLPAGSLEELRWGLADVCLRVLDAQPSMAPLARLVADVLAAPEGVHDLESGRHAVVRAIEAFRTRLAEETERSASHASDLLPAAGRIATISSSETVAAALLGASGGTARRALCFESRPLCEGRTMAEALALGGVSVDFAVDAAAGRLVPDCSAVLIGADSIGDAGVVNKVGSALLARVAKRSDVPVYVVAADIKVLPVDFPQSTGHDAPAEEVWAPPAGVRVWNRYFEAVPLDLVTAVVTGSGASPPAELEVARAALPFPEPLRRWAEGRAALP